MNSTASTADALATPQRNAGPALRIAHTVTSIAEEASGPTYSVVRLCDSLRDAGEDVTLLVLDWTPGASLPSYAKSFPLGAGPRRIARSPALRRWLGDAAEQGALDLVHSNGLWRMPNVYPGWVARRRRIPLVISPRGAFTKVAMASGSPLKQVFWPLLQRPALTPAVCFHATAEAEYLEIRRMGFQQPVAVIANGIDLPALSPRRREPARTLLFLARIHPIKGLDMLLPAWGRLQERFPDWRLRIVGDDLGYHGVSGYLAQMQALSLRSGLSRVSFDGPRYGQAKAQAYRDADLYVLPSYSENFGVTVAEALAQELPAVVTKGAPWPDLAANDAGWWCEANVDALTESLAAAMSQPRDRLDAMGASGRRWMERAFQWRSIGRQMSDTYRWLCDASLPPPPCVRLG